MAAEVAGASPAELRRWVQQVGFPALFAVGLLWLHAAKLPELGDRIAAAIEKASERQSGELRTIQDGLRELLERTPRR